MSACRWTPISREELDRIKQMARDYIDPSRPRAGYETIALYDKLAEAVMQNLGSLLARAERGFTESASAQTKGE